MKRKGCQVLVIGAGITGLTIAREFLKRGAEDIVILEKEPSIGFHASGRNSGVLHSGIYYTPDTLKARYCVLGNRLMKEFCQEKGLTIKETGKVIVTKNLSEVKILYELKCRADSSGARAIIIDQKELSEVEPYATTYEKALFCPDTAVINPKEVLQSLEDELKRSGKVAIYYNVTFKALRGNNLALTSHGAIHFGKFINAAGAYADQIAHSFGLGKEYKILPFKGTYKKLVKHQTFLVRGNIYPVPDLRNPFLGIHFTRNADNEVYVGPTAIPAFGRENYGIFAGLTWEAFSIFYRDAVLFYKNSAFRRVVLTEPRKYLPRFIFEEAKKLVSQLQPQDLEDADKIGIRPQLVNWRTKQLVMDFVVLKDGESIHILNAISPAFTSSMAFAKYAVSILLGEKETLHAI